MKRKFNPLYILVALVIVIVAVTAVMYQKRVENTPGGSAGSVKPTIHLFDQELVGTLEGDVWKFEASFDGIEAHAEIPHTTSLINLALRDEVQDIFDEFERVEAQSGCDDIELKDSASCASHSISVYVRAVDQKPLASFVVKTSMYVGGAHDMYQEQGIILDQSGRRLGLNNIFRGQYLDVLSDISRQQLQAKFQLSYGDEEGMQQTLYAGTEPDTENFRHFYIDRGVVVIIFNPYQVASWAAGVQYAVVPITDLQGYVQPEITTMYADIAAPVIILSSVPSEAHEEGMLSFDGFARTFENNVAITLAKNGTQILATATIATAPEIGMYGYFSHTIPLTPYNLKKGDVIKWDIYESSAKDGSDVIRYTDTVTVK